MTKTKEETKKIEDKDCIEIKKPRQQEVDLRFDADKRLWIVETKDLRIIKSLVERFGGDMPVIELVKKFGKDKLVLM